MADKSKYYVGLVVINSKGQVLLGKRKEDGIWTGPGGGSEEGETPKKTAVREAFEEAQLEVDSDKLIKLDTLKAGNGKDVFCFLYYTDQKKTSPKLDPDEEVNKWEWYSQDKIPKDLTKDANRHMTVMNGLMTIKGLKKSQAHKDDCKRHMAEHSKYAELHEKLKSKIKTRRSLDKNYKTPAAGEEAILNALERMDYHGGQYSKLTNTLRRKQEKESVEKSNKFIAMQDHELHEQYQADKLKEGTTAEVEKGGPGSGKQGHTTELKDEKLKDHARQLKQSYLNWTKRAKDNPEDERAKKMAKLFENKMRDFLKQYGLNKAFAKSLMGIQEGTGVAIDTADQAVTEAAGKNWLEEFRAIMDNFNYGDEPRTIELNRGHSIIMTKVDDGLYTGFVKRFIDEDGTAPLEENVAKVEQSTLSDIIQYLRSREYIKPENSSEIGQLYALQMDAAGADIEAQEQSRELEMAKEEREEELAYDLTQASSDPKLEKLRLLNSILNGV